LLHIYKQTHWVAINLIIYWLFPIWSHFDLSGLNKKDAKKILK
jgi:hypothetical protein